jgi:Na+/H+-translocating membrane pyrophosphatase
LIARKSKAKPALKNCVEIETKRALSKLVPPGTMIRSIKTDEIKSQNGINKGEVFGDEVTDTNENDQDKGE